MTVEFSLRFPVTDVHFWADRYGYADDEPVIQLGAEARNRGWLRREELIVMGVWKSPRIRKHLESNAEDVIEEITRFALAARAERARIEALTILAGVGWPMASVILHFCHRDPYPILDFRAVWSLGAEVPSDWSFSFWAGYTEFCRGLAQRAGVSMRTLDQALWQYSKETQRVE